MALLRRIELAYAVFLAWLAVGAWRFVVASAHDDSGHGQAQRAHADLLLLQGVLAILAGVAWCAVTVAARDRRPRDVAGTLAIFAAFAAAFAAIFLRHGLLDWGSYED